MENLLDGKSSHHNTMENLLMTMQFTEAVVMAEPKRRAPWKIKLFNVHLYPPHIIITVVHIFISLYVYIFPVPRIVATASNI